MEQFSAARDNAGEATRAHRSRAASCGVDKNRPHGWREPKPGDDVLICRWCEKAIRMADIDPNQWALILQSVVGRGKSRAGEFEARLYVCVHAARRGS